MTRTILTLTAAAALAGCAASGARNGTDAIRYHLGQPIAPGTVAVEAMPGGTPTVGPEFGIYSQAVGAELARLGFTPARGDATTAQYVAAVQFNRVNRGQIRTPPKFSIGIGGGSFGRGGGLGGGVSTGIGGKTRDVYATELWVQLRRRSDGTTVWEGRADRGSLVGGRDGEPPMETAGKLAAALFRGFPGESGVTISAP